MRKKENDTFILEEMSRIFGRHVLLKKITSDFSDKETL